MRAQDQGNINITCIHTRTATTKNGSPAKSYSVDALLAQFKVEIPNRGDGLKRQYSHEYAAVTSISANAGSGWTSFNTLTSGGLFDLYPELDAINQRRNVKLHRAVIDLRRFGFDCEHALSSEEIDVAARLAFSFVGCLGIQIGNVTTTDTDMHMLCWFLALRKRNSTDPKFKHWLDGHTSDELNISTKTSGDMATTSNDPEVLQYEQLVTIFKDKTLFKSRVSSSTSIDPRVIVREGASWQAHRQQTREEYREAKTKRAGHDNYHSRRARYERASRPRRDQRKRSRDYKRTERSRSPQRERRRRHKSHKSRRDDF